MEAAERRQRHAADRAVLATNSAGDWARGFLAALAATAAPTRSAA
jgi:trehalose-6-phosphate synthase